MTALARASLTSLCFACTQPEMPRVEVGGTGATIVRFDGWTQHTSFGDPVLWRAKMTRQSSDPIAAIRYSVEGPSRTLSSGTVSYRSAYDYREPFGPGDAVTLSIPAYGVGRQPVKRLVLEVVRAETPPLVDLDDVVGDDALYRANERRTAPAP